MGDAILTWVIEKGERHERVIIVASGIWFVISCASWIPQLPVPEIPYLTDRNSWVFSGAWNAIWWGMMHPLLEKRREALGKIEQEEEA